MYDKYQFHVHLVLFHPDFQRPHTTIQGRQASRVPGQRDFGTHSTGQQSIHRCFAGQPNSVIKQHPTTKPSNNPTIKQPNNQTIQTIKPSNKSNHQNTNTSIRTQPHPNNHSDVHQNAHRRMARPSAWTASRVTLSVGTSSFLQFSAI